MSVRYGLLALLASAPKHGYQLRAEFEAATGGNWPLNIGQVYTTLQRLERDGLVRPVRVIGEGQHPYELTEQGRQEVDGWLLTPLPRELSARNELALKVALAVDVGANVATVLQVQRRATMKLLHDLRASRPEPGEDLAGALATDAMAFAAEAEMNWLDHAETLLVTRPSRRKSSQAAHRDREKGTA
jgi:DNA-binding PadR family transcriptional regulator